MEMRPAVTTAFNLMKGGGATGVEIGVAFGDHAEATLLRWPQLHLILVDDYSESPEREAETRRRLAPFNTRWVKGHSAEVAQQFAPESFDYVYVDADHTYEGVMLDLAAWYPLVKVGGVFGGHDYANHTCPGVAQAVDEFFGKLSIILNVDPRSGDWWFIKTKV